MLGSSGSDEDKKIEDRFKERKQYGLESGYNAEENRRLLGSQSTNFPNSKRISNPVYQKRIKQHKRKPGEGEERKERKSISLEDQYQSREQQYLNIINLVIDEYNSSQTRGRIINKAQEAEILSQLLVCITTDPDISIKQITDALITAAQQLRNFANDEVEGAAAVSWGKYCLSFFCCAPAPAVQYQYNESRLYILIDAALKRAKKYGLIQEEINLEEVSKPVVARGLTRLPS